MKTAFLTALFAVLWLASAQAQRSALPVDVPELEKIARADSNDATAHYNVGLAYVAAKRFADADISFRRAITLDSRFASAYLARAYLPYAERASLWAEIAEERVPASWALRLEESRRLIRRAFMLDPMVDLRIIGCVLPGFDDFRDARYESAFLRLDSMIGERAPAGERDLSRVPDYMLWYHGLAAAHLNRHNEAIEDLTELYNRSLRKERNDSLTYVPLQTNELRYLLAAVKTMAGRPEEAVPLLREVTKEDLGHFMAHVQLAEISQQVGLLEQAVHHRQLAVQANPEDATLLSELGITLVRAGRPDEGIRTLAEAAALNPRDARPHYLLGLMELQRGNKEKAAAAFRQFIALAPKRYERQIADARQRLGTLE